MQICVHWKDFGSQAGLVKARGLCHLKLLWAKCSACFPCRWYSGPGTPWKGNSTPAHVSLQDPFLLIPDSSETETEGKMTSTSLQRGEGLVLCVKLLSRALTQLLFLHSFCGDFSWFYYFNFHYIFFIWIIFIWFLFSFICMISHIFSGTYLKLMKTYLSNDNYT